MCLAESCTNGQAARAHPSVLPLTPLLQHCNRQLDRLIPNSVPQLQTHQPDPPSSCPQERLRGRIGCAVRMKPQLPALLALSLALPQSMQSMHSTDSMHSIPEPEGEREFGMQTYFVCDPFWASGIHKTVRTVHIIVDMCQFHYPFVVATHGLGSQPLQLQTVARVNLLTLLLALLQPCNCTLYDLVFIGSLESCNVAPVGMHNPIPCWHAYPYAVGMHYPSPGWHAYPYPVGMHYPSPCWHDTLGLLSPGVQCRRPSAGGGVQSDSLLRPHHHHNSQLP